MLAAKLFLACIIIVCSACSFPAAYKRNINNGNEFRIPFTYAGFGIGPNPLIGAIELVHNDEAKTVSFALVEAMQHLQHSIVEPKMDLSEPLLAGHIWKTDIVPVQKQVIEEHNALYPFVALPMNRLYGIQYEGVYVIAERNLNFRIRSILYQRGAGSTFHEYYEKYSGEFFFNRVREAIKSSLISSSERQSS